MRCVGRLLLIAGLLVVALPATAQAYVGPGAGFAIAGSFMAVFAAVFSALLMILAWPFRLLMRAFFRRRPPAASRVKRVVILGLDGLDHGLTEKMLAEGRLPHLAALRAQGCLKPLGSTLPPISPVAWSSFQTGVNPGKHNIFDFLIPDPKTYQPKLSSVEIRPPRRKFRLGKMEFAFGKPDVRMLRKSQPFWKVLSDYGIFNSILRVPITFPPEKLHGVQLSAMCVPDLRGTQGTFSYYTTVPPGENEKTGGEVHIVRRNGNTVEADLWGPNDPHGAGCNGGEARGTPSPGPAARPLPEGQVATSPAGWERSDAIVSARGETRPLKCPFVVTIRDADHATLRLLGDRYELRRGVYTDWITVKFKVGFASHVSGVCRFLLLRSDTEFELYVTPINIDPENPAMPIGYPAVYPIYLAKRQGAFATLGLAEDTWGLSEDVLNDDQFLEQCVSIDREREAMFFDSLDKVPQGLCVCVFDGTDRMQHMFWRYLDEDHPARPKEPPPAHRNAIQDLYVRMDGLVGRTMARCQGPDTMLMVLSDHGFNTFRRGIDLNRWLEEQGYLKVDDARRDKQYLAGIDWSQTRAFCLGLTGIFLNIKDKFSQGIVDGGAEAEQLRAEIAEKLSALVDPATGDKAIKRVYQAPKAYRGPYKDQAPDLIVGYQRGYRVSWESAVGKTTREIFHDNVKAWSGDHCVDPSVVPGVLFCNRPVANDNPRLLDIAPTVLSMFGITPPDYMDGKPLEVGEWSTAGSPPVEDVLTKVV